MSDMSNDEGGEGPCLAHLFEAPDDDLTDRDDIERFALDLNLQAAAQDPVQ